MVVYLDVDWLGRRIWNLMAKASLRARSFQLGVQFGFRAARVRVEAGVGL